MKLLEVKNDLAKIIFKPDDHNFLLSDFLVVADRGISLLSQIIHLESSDDDMMICFVKFLLNVDENGNISSYNGFTPFKKTSKIFPVEPKDILPLLKSSNANISLGQLASKPELSVDIDYNFLRNKLYIQSDNQSNTNIFVKNILENINKFNVPAVLIDFDGIFADFNYERITLGNNFKLPLNFELLDYIYKNDLSELNLREKVTVQDIILDLQSFVKTAKSKFIPFDTFYNIIESEYIKNPSDGIILMRNKLIKYAQDGIFAQSQKQFANLNQYIKNSGTLIIDLSKIQEKWHKISLNFILKLIWDKCIFITSLNNENSNKNLLQNIFNSNIIYPVVISNYAYGFASDIKMIAKNLVLFSPVAKTNDFASYNTFLNKLGSDEFIIWGKNTQYLSFILKLQSQKEPDFDVVEQISSPVQVSLPNNTVNNNLNSEVREPVRNIAEEVLVAETEITEEDEDKIIERDVDEMLFGKPKSETPQEEEVIIEEEPVVEEDEENTVVIDEKDLGTTSIPINFESTTLDTSQQKIGVADEQILTPTDDSAEVTSDESVEVTEPDESSEIFIDEIDDIDLDLIDEINSEENTPEIVEDTQTVEADGSVVNIDGESDVSSEIIEETPESMIVEEPQVTAYEPSEEVIQFEEFNEEEFFKENTSVNNQVPDDVVNVEPQPQNTNQTTSVKQKNGNNLPIYTSNNKPQNDLEFQEGNYVFHQKYGKGVVEKIVPYSNKKILYSIVFDNGKRRLLDPNVTDLKKV